LLSPEPINPASAASPLVDPDPIQIGIIQGNVPTRIKLFEEGLRRAFTGYTDGYIDLVNQGVDAVLTPEGAIPLYWQPNLSKRTPIYQAVVDRGIPLWLGTFVPVGNDYTQSIITLDADGTLFSQYNKVKLVPLGEYIPFSSVLGDLVDRLSPLDAYMIPGDASQQVKTPVGQAIVGICYESAFADLFRQQAANGGDFILTASNNDPFNTVMMAQHHAQDVMRAIETDRWAVRVTNTGYSGLVDPQGRTVWRSPANEYVTHVATLWRRHTQTPYVRYGDWLTPVLVISGAIALTWQRLSRSSTQQGWE
jgi:apolipoprotein N-acyltransferase